MQNGTCTQKENKKTKGKKPYKGEQNEKQFDPLKRFKIQPVLVTGIGKTFAQKNWDSSSQWLDNISKNILLYKGQNMFEARKLTLTCKRVQWRRFMQAFQAFSLVT